MSRTYGETKDCRGCRFWSEMVAQSIGWPSFYLGCAVGLFSAFAVSAGMLLWLAALTEDEPPFTFAAEREPATVIDLAGRRRG